MSRVASLHLKDFKNSF